MAKQEKLAILNAQGTRRRKTKQNHNSRHVLNTTMRKQTQIK